MKCRCWTLPSREGAPHPAASLAIHGRIAVTTKDGRRLEATSDVYWRQAESTLSPMLRVVDDSGAESWCSPEDIQFVEPIEQADDLALLEVIVALLQTPSRAPADGISVRLATGTHESLEVTIRRRTWPCCPSPSISK